MRRATGTTLSLVLWTSAICLAPGADAVDLETLVMPGPVAEAHADVETECGKCHRPFDRAAENALCVDCHDDVGEDVRAATGFHGRSDAARSSACRTCHTEHRGREADIVGLNPARFDHALTDHPLHGAHARVACADCHSGDSAFRDAPSDCVACHGDDDPHRERLGTACGDCHGEATWREARFDHGQTDFPLEGAHADVACQLCHAGERYEDTPSDCASCHALDDVHRGSFGPECGTCHDTVDWKRSGFDHDRDTDFPLEGSHRGTDCATCHTGPLHEQTLDTACVSCHRPDDVHRGRRGEDCASCHSAAAWSETRFDHDRDTGFPLRGGHADASCESCHGSDVHAPLEETCISCHASDDVHAGEQGEACGTCHDEHSWTGRVRFDHDVTRFPLLGLHATAPCEACHASPRYREAESECVACHARDDAHESTLGAACATCHNPNAWATWRFDHDAETSFALHGAHEGVDCRTCHPEPVPAGGAIELPGTCVACHVRDDAHRGAFGRDCARCHDETAWDDPRLP